MTIKRMTKSEVPMSFGAFKPVGHVVVAFPGDREAQAASQALRLAGFDDEDILYYSAAEEGSQMAEMLPMVSGVAGFGAELPLMRQHQQLAEEGCAWLVVYAPEAERTARVAVIVQRHGAIVAQKYGRLLIEELI